MHNGSGEGDLRVRLYDRGPKGDRDRDRECELEVDDDAEELPEDSDADFLCRSLRRACINFRSNFLNFEAILSYSLERVRVRFPMIVFSSKSYKRTLERKNTIFFGDNNAQSAIGIYQGDNVL